MLHHHGQLGPAEIPAKREYTFAHVFRLAARRGLVMRGPARHPFNPITALRLCLNEVAGDRHCDVIHAIFDAGWRDGGDLSDPAVLRRAIDGIGLDGEAMIAHTREPRIKAALRANTERAVASPASLRIGPIKPSLQHITPGSTQLPQTHGVPQRNQVRVDRGPRSAPPAAPLASPGQLPPLLYAAMVPDGQTNA
ncbi:MAG: DsbA family protein [Myxococcota bacterium]